MKRGRGHSSKRTRGGLRRRGRRGRSGGGGRGSFWEREKGEKRKKDEEETEVAKQKVVVRGEGELLKSELLKGGGVERNESFLGAFTSSKRTESTLADRLTLIKVFLRKLILTGKRRREKRAGERGERKGRARPESEDGELPLPFQAVPDDRSR